LEGKEFSEYIGALGDVKDLELLKSFVSIYDVGDFLSIHEDPNYNVAFILNLTKDWKYEYGGCLTVLENDKPEVILPKFNSLVLMFLGDEGIEHYVSEVSRLAPHPRIAISGWYNRNSS
jgi:Rps23 Pro-64 3,4-dihydroxylase Tpa1-like proline 4-hydroxylase